MHVRSGAFCLKVQTKYIQVVRQSLIIDFLGNAKIEPGKHSSWMKSCWLLDQSFINSIINMEGVEGRMVEWMMYSCQMKKWIHSVCNDC